MRFFQTVIFSWHYMVLVAKMPFIFYLYSCFNSYVRVASKTAVSTQFWDPSPRPYSFGSQLQHCSAFRRSSPNVIKFTSESDQLDICVVPATPEKKKAENWSISSGFTLKRKINFLFPFFSFRWLKARKPWIITSLRLCDLFTRTHARMMNNGESWWN